MLQVDKRFMEIAIAEAVSARRTGNYSIGAVIEKNGTVVAKSPNVTRTFDDPTRHAELEVIREAIKIIGEKFLDGCVLYTTHEPCPMCAAACVWARLKGVVFGAKLEDMIYYSRENGNDRWRWRTINIKAQEVFSKTGHKVEVVEGVMRDECIKLFHS